MSDRTKGLLNISANFEPQTAEPFDARMRVTTKASLLLEATWASSDSNVYTYVGMIVSVYNDTLENNGIYRLIGEDYTIQSNWIKADNVISLMEDTTYYVDGDNGDDTDDGLTWGTAKKTFGFLMEDAVDSVPRRLEADLTVMVRGTAIRARSAAGHFVLKNFYGSGTITIEGVLETVTTFTATSYQNDLTVRGAGVWVADPTKNWAVDGYRRHFVDIGQSYYYPCCTNDATTLWLGTDSPILTGSPAGTIYSAPEILRELEADPGNKYEFTNPEYFFSVNKCKCDVTIKNLWVDEDFGNYNWAEIAESDSITIEKISFSTINTYNNLSIFSRSCFFNTSNGGFIWSVGNNEISIVLYAIGGDDTGYGFQSDVTIYNSFYGGIVVNQYQSFLLNSGNIFLNKTLIKDCISGVVLNNSSLFVYAYDPTREILRFDGCIKAISGNGTLISMESVVLGWDVTTEIEFSNNDIGAFDSLNDKTLKSRVAMRVAYVDSGFSDISNLDEFNNIVSGLDAYNYQEAIDALASRSIKSDVTYYVDGDNGSDAYTGLSWVAAKKTFAFLYSGDEDAIPREINADVTISCKGTILSKTIDRHTKIDSFYGSGKLQIIGEIQDVITGQTPTSWDNTTTSLTYHSYVEVSGASWVVDDYQGMYIQFTTPASDVLYPILSNTATKIETVALPSLAGTEVFKVIRLLTNFKAATVADPNTIIDPYPGVRIFSTLDCNIPIAVKKIQAVRGDGTDCGAYNYFSIGSILNSYNSFSEGSSTLIKNCNISYCFLDGANCSIIGSNFFGYVSNVFWNHGWIYCYASTTDLSISGSIFYGRGAEYSKAIDILSPTQVYITDSRFFDYLCGVSFLQSTIIGMAGSLFEQCDSAVYIDDSKLMIQYYMSGAYSIKFKDNTTCIDMGSNSLLSINTAATSPFYGSGNSRDIVIVNESPYIYYNFNDLSSQTQIENIRTGARVEYWVGDSALASQTRYEYNNAVSGLDSYFFQGAIDILAARSIESDITYYVDGDIGSDSNNGLSWGTAKKTFSFLYSGDGYAIPREINANVVVNSRGNVYSKTADRHTEIDKFYGSGTLKIAGTFSDVVVGQSVTGYDNTVTNVTYHSYIDSGAASWGIDDYKGMFVQFTTPASDILYPILSNTATRIETISLPALAGTEVFKVVRPATELISATYSSPGTIIHHYPEYFIVRVHQCFIPIEISGVKYLTSSESANYFSIGSDSKNDQENSVSEFKTGIKYSVTSTFLLECFNVDILSCFIGYNPGGYSGISNSILTKQLYVKNCVLDGVKTTSQTAIFAWHPTTLSVEGNRFFNYDVAIGTESFCYTTLGNNLIESCNVGVQLNRSTWDCFDIDRYNRNDICINLTGTQMKVYGVLTNYGNLNRKDIIVANTPTEVSFTFAQLAAKEEIYNTKNNALVQYYKSGDSISVTSYHEYSRTNSGLDAYNYQEAIDILATFATRKASASQDGYLGKDDFIIFSSGGHNPVTLNASAVTGGLSLNTQELSFRAATTDVDGYLKSSDWDIFNGKITDPMSARGDIIYRNSSNITDRLSLGLDGYYLGSNGSDLIWKSANTTTYFSQPFTLQTSVVVNHNLGAYPVVQVMDSGNAVMIPQSITNTTVDSFTVLFSEATSGTILATLGTSALVGAQSILSPGGLSLGENKTAGTVNTNGYLRMWSGGDNDYYSSFITGTQNATATYTLPLSMPDSNKVLQSTSAGVMSWVASSSITLNASAITGGLSLNAQELSARAATTAVDGYLKHVDWNTFYNKEPAVTKGALTSNTTSAITITSGNGAVIGNGTSITLNKASASQDGYLGKDDFVTFSNGGAAYKIYEGNTKAEVHDTGSDGYFWVATEGVEKFRVSPDGKVGIGQNSPTAMLHLPAGTVVANTAPLKFVTGNALSNPEDGVVEYHSSHLYFTIGSTRYQLDQQGGGGSLQVSYSLGNEISLTSGIPVKITNNYAASAAIEISGTGRREIHSTDDIVLASDGETYFVDGGYTGTQGPDGYIPLTDSGARDFTFPCSSLVDAINKAYVGSGGNFNWSGTTTNDTPTEIFVGGVASARYTLTADSTTYLSLSVIARDNINNRSKVWEVKAAAQRPSVGTADWIRLTPTYTVIDQTDPSGGTNDWNIVLSINDPDKTVRVTVTGQTSSTIQWAVLN